MMDAKASLEHGQQIPDLWQFLVLRRQDIRGPAYTVKQVGDQRGLRFDQFPLQPPLGYELQ